MRAEDKYKLFLALGMVITGSINTISTKWADNQRAIGKPEFPEHDFDHPFLQAVGMFIGEFTCLIAFQIWRRFNKKKVEEGEIDVGSDDFSPFLLCLPACCDMLGTSTMYFGLTLTFASSFQMLRGAVMLFTAIFSVIFLKAIIQMFRWAGIGVVIVGLAAVGVSDMLKEIHNGGGKDLSHVLIGDGLIIAAQVIVAAQMVIEEKFVNGKNIHPLRAVGWEGFFGACILSILLVPFYYIILPPNFCSDPFEPALNGSCRLEDAIDGLMQMGNNGIIVAGVVMNILSIAFFNYFGLSVTKTQSATTRMVLDSIRTVVIWAFTLAVGWETVSIYTIPQVFGFMFLIFGTCLYNDLVIRQAWYKYVLKKPFPTDDDDQEPILEEGDDNPNYDAIGDED
ncbi:Oidioi.mRNA.OKI2018_I69.XSR.g16443.t1.cds [Oikopleura dioica]|uniref:Oidioi.mRNA.OKI2018_I69.XSR.g16443.t1.cds n=1 Tax=Oikopleura dioica TaxID=34765 RepID=A0ABN7SL73_OIKDI|nr:Oidioi.mRNA.OKI2018_I69.XSR.g16443.t1.cds [Oikopleura dioica]